MLYRITDLPQMAGKFEKGEVVYTIGIKELVECRKIAVFDMLKCLRRHIQCDWGDICKQDKQSNNEALKYNERLLSSYMVNNIKIWVITEADRSVTTILLPDEY